MALADSIAELDLSLFEAPNDNARRGRRNALANRLRAAALDVDAVRYAAAVDVLEGVFDRIDGVSPPPDWMVVGPQRDLLAADVVLAIALIGML